MPCHVCPHPPQEPIKQFHRAQFNRAMAAVVVVSVLEAAAGSTGHTHTDIFRPSKSKFLSRL